MAAVRCSGADRPLTAQEVFESIHDPDSPDGIRDSAYEPSVDALQDLARFLGLGGDQEFGDVLYFRKSGVLRLLREAAEREWGADWDKDGEGGE